MDLRDNQVEMKLNIRDLLWDLLTQWKAVLLASLIRSGRDEERSCGGADQ